MVLFPAANCRMASVIASSGDPMPVFIANPEPRARTTAMHAKAIVSKVAVRLISTASVADFSAPDWLSATSFSIAVDIFKYVARDWPLFTRAAPSWFCRERVIISASSAL